MYEVIVILSAHKERGLFRASSLIDVLYGVRPDAIFLEHSSAEYERFNGLEKKVAEQYLVNNQIPVIPSGKRFSENQILESYQKHELLSRALEIYSSEDYRVKYDDHVQRECLEGFSYLHSHDYGLAQKFLKEEEEKIVASTGSQEIYQTFQWWHELQRSRETFILENIEQRVLKCGYRRSALLIGAEHRNSLLDAAKDSSCREIEWLCYEC